ncbi:hypothetical protein SAY86_005362 [Trapa natans]|uniref:Uncharacterized protein n=1 Tax=Trapa natans TaxID=22666 RepID=A0AAN7QRD3_TRANT|nr:hypothetical protein SAY86_005362 [Trapa natans]
MARRAPASLGTALQLIAVLLTSDFMAEEVEGIWMNLPASGTKCVSEEIHHNKIVVADYMIVSEDPYNGPTISIKDVRRSSRSNGDKFWTPAICNGVELNRVCITFECGDHAGSRLYCYLAMVSRHHLETTFIRWIT